MKKSILILITLCFAIMAQAYDLKSGDLYYNITNNLGGGKYEVEVTYGDKKYSGDIRIPDLVEADGNTYHVFAIGDLAFSGCTGLTSVKIAGDIKTIGFRAFHGCTGLTSVTIPKRVTLIDKEAFLGCSSLYMLTLTTTSIAENAFEGCTGLTLLYINNGVKDIYKGAFKGCTSLSMVVIQDTTLNTVGKGAFEGCPGTLAISTDFEAVFENAGFTYLILNEGVTEVQPNRIINFPNLKKVYVYSTLSSFWTSSEYSWIENCPSLMEYEVINNESFFSFDGCIYRQDGGLLFAPFGVQSITLSDKFLNSSFKFENCPNLKTLMAQSLTQYKPLGSFATSAPVTLVVPQSLLAQYKNDYKDASNITVLGVGDSAGGIPEDVNQDGKINSLDVLKVYKYMQAH